MKLNNLKQLVKEELTKAINEVERDLKAIPLENMAEGTYEIKFIVADPEGGPDYSETTSKSITRDEFDKNMNISTTNFWKGIARSAVEAPIYKVTKVTKL
jgi:hypothetical protein